VFSPIGNVEEGFIRLFCVRRIDAAVALLYNQLTCVFAPAGKGVITGGAVWVCKKAVAVWAEHGSALVMDR
jgi:hypothetical protein